MRERTIRSGWDTGDWSSTPAVVLDDYDPAWPQQFEQERAAIETALDGIDAAVEHVGSTAIPGLAAKRSIDILVGLADLGALEQCVKRLVALGYDYHFTQGDWTHLSRQDHKVHVTARGGDFWTRTLVFRDYLRAHPEAAQEYEALKRRLAVESGQNRERYVDGKTAFVQSVLAQAEREQAG
jgi:GrpB-like predicted nucleotidyltransferase (UPF0157 family)